MDIRNFSFHAIIISLKSTLFLSPVLCPYFAVVSTMVPRPEQAAWVTSADNSSCRVVLINCTSSPTFTVLPEPRPYYFRAILKGKHVNGEPANALTHNSSYHGLWFFEYSTTLSFLSMTAFAKWSRLRCADEGAVVWRNWQAILTELGGKVGKRSTRFTRTLHSVFYATTLSRNTR